MGAEGRRRRSARPRGWVPPYGPPAFAQAQEEPPQRGLQELSVPSVGVNGVSAVPAESAEAGLRAGSLPPGAPEARPPRPGGARAPRCRAQTWYKRRGRNAFARGR